VTTQLPEPSCPEAFQARLAVCSIEPHELVLTQAVAAKLYMALVESQLPSPLPATAASPELERMFGARQLCNATMQEGI